MNDTPVKSNPGKPLLRARTYSYLNTCKELVNQCVSISVYQYFCVIVLVNDCVSI